MNLKKKLLLVATLALLLCACNKVTVPDLVDVSKDLLLTCNQTKSCIQAITTEHVLIVSGTRKLVLSGKLVTLPAGSALGMYSGKLNTFYLRDFCAQNQKQFPILLTKPVQDSILAQEAMAKKYKFNLTTPQVSQ